MYWNFLMTPDYNSANRSICVLNDVCLCNMKVNTSFFENKALESVTKVYKAYLRQDVTCLRKQNHFEQHVPCYNK